MATDRFLDSDWDEEDWGSLIDTIHSGKCVLMLGPDIAVRDGESGSLNSQLARRYAVYLEDALPPREFNKIDLNNLPRLSLLYGREKGGDNYPRTSAKNFFQDHKNITSSLHCHLAALPFRVIITSSHDEMFLRGLESKAKTPQYRWYNFVGNQDDIIPTGTVESPMVYYLYGHPDVPESMVLTENDLLDFLVSVIKGVPALPDNLRSMFNSKDTCYLCLGFGFSNWYLRILFHVIQKKKKNSSVALEKVFEDRLRELKSNAFFFKKSGHNLRIVGIDAAEFAVTLNSEYYKQYPDGETKSGSAPSLPADAPVVFISHANENKDQASILCQNLEKNGIKAWFDRKDLFGGVDFNDEIETAIKEKIDYFILLNSAELENRNEGYVIRELNTALDRQKEVRKSLSFIIPVSFDNTKVMDEVENIHQISLPGPENIEDIVTSIKRDQVRRQSR